MSQQDQFYEELQDWIEALDNSLISDGKEYSIQLLSALIEEALSLIHISEPTRR